MTCEHRTVRFTAKLIVCQGCGLRWKKSASDDSKPLPNGPEIKSPLRRYGRAISSTNGEAPAK